MSSMSVASKRQAGFWLPSASLGKALLLSLLLAALTFGAAFIRPETNWDALTYSALAKEFRGEEGHLTAYREMKERVAPEIYAAFTAGPYREKMEQDGAYFAANLPFYASKPAYIAAIGLIGGIAGSDFWAMSFVSGLSTALAIIISFFAARMLLPADKLLIVPIAWVVGLGLKIATLFTPDAMAICLQMLFLLVWLKRKDGPVQMALLVAVAMAWVATRANALLFIVILCFVETVLDRFARATLIRTAALVAGALAVYLAVVKATGNHGQLVLFNFVFVDKPDGLAFPNSAFLPVDYLRAIVFGLFEAVTGYPEFILCALALCWLVLQLGQPLLRGEEPADHETLVLAAAMLLALGAHFALYPAAWERFFVGYYVTTILLLARTLIGAPPLLRAG
ncbi:hypothetical protein [Bosea sp. BH3]|uniref:hypothetical protein n=1 Tax=Bosea sp. BH3 TaxID=2871701 RepID=UPI0021CB169A|nr:hypothetical protein [Bosea sp. BH3]MCU4181341.1 hypothetical protein [Bosea sp. BH3]